MPREQSNPQVVAFRESWVYPARQIADVSPWCVGEHMTRLQTPLASWAHRKGIARVLNTASNGGSPSMTAYVETRGPRCFGALLLSPAMHADARRMGRLIDLNSVHVDRHERLSRWRHRWHLTFQRVGVGPSDRIR